MTDIQKLKDPLTKSNAMRVTRDMIRNHRMLLTQVRYGNQLQF